MKIENEEQILLAALMKSLVVLITLYCLCLRLYVYNIKDLDMASYADDDTPYIFSSELQSFPNYLRLNLVLM